MKRKTNIPREVACIICEVKFMTTHSQGKYCSQGCRQKGWRKSWNEYGDRNRKARRENGRQWYRKNRKKKIAQTKAYHKTPRGKLATKISDARQNSKFPEKRLARTLVGMAQRKKLIIKQPCEICGILKVEAHHDDYSKPLDVKWFCNKHHKEYEKKAVKE